ncbi:trigger factor [Trema orientale]|uniref:Trigger factor n=1 Tax=Trema orientale TaxID=63057 RepID=A0A2P5BFY8_TREOI|nr:trigger factor [Trema orientale]
MKMNMKIEQETTYHYSFDTAKDEEQLTIDSVLRLFGTHENHRLFLNWGFLSLNQFKGEMEDVLTEIPPPSRFHEEDLNNFTPPSPPIPSPFLLFSNPKPNEPLRPNLLIIAISFPSLYVLHHVPSKALIGSLVLPETPFSGNSIEPSLRDKSCNIYNVGDAKNSILLVSVQCPVAAERAHVVAKLLIGEQIIPERVVVFNSVQRQNFRGRLSPDETFAFKLETSSERKELSDSHALRGLDYLPSGSVVDGLAAALLARCQMRNIKGALCVAWPEVGGAAVDLVKSILRNVSPSLDIGVHGNAEDEGLWSSQNRDHHFDSDLYT